MNDSDVEFNLHFMIQWLWGVLKM